MLGSQGPYSEAQSLDLSRSGKNEKTKTKQKTKQKKKNLPVSPVAHSDLPVEDFLKT